MDVPRVQDGHVLEDLVGALPPATTGMVQGLEDVGGGEVGEGSAVPDGLHPRIRLTDLLERGRLEPEAHP